MSRFASIGVQGSLLLACSTASSGIGGQSDAHAEVEGRLRARGVGILKLTIPGDTEIADVGLEISRDGVDFTMLRTGGSRNSRDLYEISYEESMTTIVAPVAVEFGVTNASFVFPESGRYWIRWGLRFKDPQVERLTLNQEVLVSTAHADDIAFVSRLGDTQFFQELVGEDVLNRLTGKARELTIDPSASVFRFSVVLRPLLASTATIEPLEGEHRSAQAFRRWTDTMFGLASELPDSTYAPYAAFYAGGGYVGYLCEHLFKDEVPSDAIREERLFKKAEEALKLAVEHGDSYVRPRALCQQARLHAIIGAWEETEHLLSRALEVAGVRGTLNTLVEHLRRATRGLKERDERRARSGKASSIGQPGEHRP